MTCEANYSISLAIFIFLHSIERKINICWFSYIEIATASVSYMHAWAILKK